jgi:hypothetical protein
MTTAAEQRYDDLRQMHVVFENVRLSFPSLTEFETYKGKVQTRYGVVLMINKQDQQAIDAFNNVYNIAAEMYQLKTNVELPNQIACAQNARVFSVSDGDAPDAREEYNGYYLLKVGRRKPIDLYAMPNQAGQTMKLTMEAARQEGWVINGGHHCKAVVQVWHEKNNGLIVADVLMLQHVAVGEEFSGGVDTSKYVNGQAANAPAAGGSPIAAQGVATGAAPAAAVATQGVAGAAGVAGQAAAPAQTAAAPAQQQGAVQGAGVAQESAASPAQGPGVATGVAGAAPAPAAGGGGQQFA